MNIGATVVLVVELIVLFSVVAFGIELLQRRLGPERLRSWMGGRPLTAALKGIAIGFVTPFCTYSAVPLLVGLRRAGVQPAGYVAFIVAAPVLDPILFGALVVIVGADVAVVYFATAFTAALTLAMIAQRVGIERQLKAIESPSETNQRIPIAVGAASGLHGASPDDPVCHADTGQGEHIAWRGWPAELGHARDRAIALLRSVAGLLAVGVAVGLAIESLVSPEAAAQITGRSSVLSIPVAAALGTPLYFHTELFVPIADALADAGVGVGTIVALTIAGAGANVPEFIILHRLACARLIAILFGYVFAVAVTGGLIAQAIA